jgi:hypothetical protein
MMFFDEERAFCTPYTDFNEFLVDTSYVITDPFDAICRFVGHFSLFLFWSLPLTLGALSFNVPVLMLFSLPIALSFLSITTPMIIAMAVVALLAAPAAYSLGLALYDAVDFFLSPLVDLLRITTNVTATLVEQVSFDEVCGF